MMSGRGVFALSGMLLVWLLAEPAAAQDLDLDMGLDEDLGEDDSAADERSSNGEHTSDDEDDSGGDVFDDADEPGGGQGTGEGPAEDARVSGFELEIAAGLGAGSRGFSRPTPVGRQRLPDAAHMAASVSLRVRLWPADAFSLDVLAAYQTSVGLTVREQPLFGLPEDIPVRSSRVALALAPSFALSDAEGGLRVAVPTGFSLRTLLPEYHAGDQPVAGVFPVPEYTIGGPFVRPELAFLLAERVRVRIGPEVQWVLLLDPTLERDGACCQGLAVGGQASLSLDLSPHLSTRLFYRESHVFITSNTERMSDVERFLTAGVAGRL